MAKRQAGHAYACRVAALTACGHVQKRGVALLLLCWLSARIAGAVSPLRGVVWHPMGCHAL
ncbi:MAG: hypothetical protein MR900_01755 [Prevotella sp.]|nr:hypothetical protein [Prevotella sp.]